MVARKIVWTKDAAAELKEITDYFNNRNKSSAYSKKLIETINNYTHSISKNPHLGRESERENIRYLIVNDYEIIYQIAKFEINILSFWDCRMNPESKRWS